MIANKGKHYWKHGINETGHTSYKMAKTRMYVFRKEIWLQKKKSALFDKDQ